MGIVRVIIQANDGKNGIDPRGPMTVRQWAKFGEPRKLPRPPRFVKQDDATADRPPTWHYAGWMVDK